MSARLPSKRSRTWDRGSFRRDRRRDGGSPIRNDRIGRRELQSPKRSKGRWDSPPRSHKSDVDSAGRSQRKGFGSPLTVRRNDSEDGLRAAHGQYFRRERENLLQAERRGDDRQDGQGPAGLVFLCTNLTKRDCFQYRILGLPSAQREVVERVSPGTKLFLFNLDTSELSGIFEAASSGGSNLVPEAFQEFKGSYAAQVHFRIYRECLPLVGDIVRDALKENFSQSSRFDCVLTADQVHKLIQLFSQSELRLQNPGQRMGSLGNNERQGQESRGPIHASMGVNATPFEQNGGQLISMAERANIYEKNNLRLASSMNFSEAPHHINKEDASFVVGTQIAGESAYPNPAAVLGQGQIEEVDQLALKYLQNHPGYLDIRLEPLDTMSNLGYSRPQSIHGLSNPLLNYARREDGRTFTDTSIQPISGVQFGPGSGISSVNLQQENGMQPHLRDAHFPGGGFNAIPGFPRMNAVPVFPQSSASFNVPPAHFRESGGMGHPASSLTGLPLGLNNDLVSSRKDNAHSLKATSEYQVGTLGLLPNEKGMGILPLPGALHSAQLKSDLSSSFHLGAAVSLQGTVTGTDTAAQSVLLANSSLPMQPFQAAQVANNPQVSLSTRPPMAANKQQRRRMRTRKGHQGSAAARSQKEAGVHDANENNSAPGAT